ncbi:porin family protein [Fibrobacter sp.]|uniref:porin family protein n=1 Tax=Fibrobacter sp. TaxID=35828 RepID=UPI0025BBCF9E|nr:porin family protein [Fibrobacter sp.]MBR3073798.1 PorT family protein [Fibrobacter sp.]
MLKKIIIAALLVTSAVFAQISIGGRAAVNYGTAWGENTDDIKWGIGFNAGAAAKIDILPIITFVPGVEVELRTVSADSPFADELSYSFWYLDFPLLARFSIIPMVFADVGVNIGFNLIASEKKKIAGETITEDVEEAKTVDFGFIVGGGVSVIPNLDINVRIVLGIADMMEDFGDIGSKNLRFQAGVTYWFL